MKDTINIFNLHQVVKFVENDCIPIGCGIGYNKKLYITFVRDENFEVVMKRWQNKEFKIN